MKLDGIGLFIKDIKVMAEFYKNILGFEIEWDGNEAKSFNLRLIFEILYISDG